MQRFLPLTVLFWLALFVATTPATQVRAGGCCHHGRHHCGACCCCCNNSNDGPQSKDVERPIFNRSPLVQAPIIQAAPVFAMPMMFTGMPMATMNTQLPASKDAGEMGRCESRLNDLEKKMSDLATNVQNLQDIVKGQTELLKVIVEAKK